MTFLDLSAVHFDGSPLGLDPKEDKSMALSENKLLVYSVPWVRFFVWTAVSKSCYYPDGIQATDNTPCYQNANASVGVCWLHLPQQWPLPARIIPFRGTCTDSTCKSEICASYCKNGRSSKKSLSGWDQATSAADRIMHAARIRRSS